MGVGNRRAGDGQLSIARINQGLRRDAPGLQTQADRERLHDRARLEGICQRPVAQLLAAQILPFSGCIARVIGQRQHFTGNDIEHHHTASPGLVEQHGVTQFLIGKKLHLAVHAELQIRAIHRCNLFAHILHHAPQAVLENVA